MKNETALVELWHKIANTSPETVLAGNKLKYIEDSRTQPGYVGGSFDTGRLLFIGMYPGGEARGNDNESVFQAIAEIRDHKEPDAFWHLNNVLRGEISSNLRPWSIWKYIQLILVEAGYSIDEFALINLCPWRCEDRGDVKASKAAADMYEDCWKEFVSQQIKELSPRLVIALGTPNSKGGTGYFLREKQNKNEFRAPLLSITRSQNDRNFREHEAPYKDCRTVIEQIKRRPEEYVPLRPTINFDKIFDPVSKE